MYILLCMYVCMYVYTYVCIIYVCMYTFMNGGMYVCMDI